ncbi:MAG: ABC transporter permease [Candidatus Pacebacteria bacterium]|nr:ABC transporter permease [Candidatus Paceibacterota bacterium]
MNSTTLTTIYILWLRQIKKYFRSKSRIIGSLGQPLLFLLVLGFGLGPIFEKGGGGDYILFLSPGIIAMSILFAAVFSGIEIIWDRRFGFLKETLVAPVSRTAVMIGRTLGGATTAFFQGSIVLLITFCVGFHTTIIGALLSLVVMFTIAVIFAALGTIFGSLMQDIQGFGLIVNLLVMPLFFLAGALFPLDTAPTAIRIVSDINPLTYGVDAMRHVLTGVTHFGLFTDALVLSGVVVLAIAVGAYLFSKIEA